MDSESHPVFARLDITLVGAADLVERQVLDLSQRMAAEVESRSSRRATAPPPGGATTADYFAFIGERGVGMANEAQLAGAAIERSALPSGSPALFVQNYARLLDCVLSARDDIRAQTMPAEFQTPGAWDEFANGIYDQIVAWPDQMRAAAQRNTADRLRLVLVSKQSIAPVERAIAADTHHLGSQNVAIERHTAFLGQNKGCATVLVTILAAFFR